MRDGFKKFEKLGRFDEMSLHFDQPTVYKVNFSSIYGSPTQPKSASLLQSPGSSYSLFKDKVSLNERPLYQKKSISFEKKNSESKNSDKKVIQTKKLLFI